MVSNLLHISASLKTIAPSEIKNQPQLYIPCLSQSQPKMKVKYNPDTDIPSLKDKVIIVTGGNEGLGKQTVLDLSKHQPSKIFLTARTAEKANRAIAEIQSKAGADVAPIEFLQLDLSSFDSIKQAARELQSRTSRLDILIANAGVLGSPAVTKEGYELHFGINHVGTSLFIRLLLPLMETTASSLPADAPKGSTRVVILSSNSERHSPANAYTFDIIKTPCKELGQFERYGQSKLANLHYAQQLAKHFPEEKSGVRFVSLHPGAVRSQLGAEILPMPQVAKDMVREIVGWFVGMVPVEEGVWNQLWAATMVGTKDDGSGQLGEPQNGEFYFPVAVTGKGSKKVRDEDLSRQLWEWTEKELGPHLG